LKRALCKASSPPRDYRSAQRGNRKIVIQVAENDGEKILSTSVTHSGDQEKTDSGLSHEIVMARLDLALPIIG
jgi:hypothetical protein